jgi:hypothetical protein
MDTNELALGSLGVQGVQGVRGVQGEDDRAKRVLVNSREPRVLLRSLGGCRLIELPSDKAATASIPFPLPELVELLVLLVLLVLLELLTSLSE